MREKGVGAKTKAWEEEYVKRLESIYGVCEVWCIDCGNYQDQCDCENKQNETGESDGVDAPAPENP